MLIIALLYIGIGAGLVIATLGARGFRRKLDHMAHRNGMGTGYGRAVWLGGTVVLWPIGLYTLMTGRLVMVDEPLCERMGKMEGPSDMAAIGQKYFGKGPLSSRLRTEFSRSPPGNSAKSARRA